MDMTLQLAATTFTFLLSLGRCSQSCDLSVARINRSEQCEFEAQTELLSVSGLAAQPLVTVAQTAVIERNVAGVDPVLKR